MFTRQLVFFTLFAALLSGAGACGPASTDAPAPAVLAPGDDLFDGPLLAVPESLPESNLPDSVLEKLRAVLEQPAVELDPADWTQAGLADRDFAYRVLGGTHHAKARDASYWRLRPPFSPELGLGELLFKHEGRPLRRRTIEHEGRTWVFWFDTLEVIIFAWDDDTHGFLALSEKRPGKVRFGYGGRSALDLDLKLWEPRLRGASVERPRGDLLGRLTFQLVDRPALLAPAPSSYRVEVDELAVDTLELACGVVDLGFLEAGDQVGRRARASDGVTFAVEVEHAGQRTRVWERHCEVAPRFREARVDLSPWKGEAVTLRLLTEPGPEADAAYDYALWSGLRFGGEPRRPPARPHVIFIDVDTLRADRLGMYGYARETSPRLDAWARREAVIYDDAIAVNNWTLPSTSSMLTGLAVHQHGVVQFPRTLTPAHKPLATRLKALGYETLGRTDGGWLIPAFGFAQDMDRFDHAVHGPADHQARGWTPELELLRARRSERPVFAFLQTYQVHQPLEDDRRFEEPAAPYAGPLAERPVNTADLTALAAREGGVRSEDWQYLDDIYDAGVRRMDDVVGEFLEGLPEVFGDEPYVVILTSDHGEELGERGTTGHGQSLHSEQLRVPLLIRFPDGAGAGTRVDAPVSALDIVPTVLELVGTPIPEELPGLPLTTAPPALRTRVAQHMESAHAVLHGGLKLVTGALPHDGVERFELPDLFDRVNDRAELRDLAEERPDRVEQLERGLEQWLSLPPPHGLEAGELDDVSAGAFDNLKDLGYFGDEN